MIHADASSHIAMALGDSSAPLVSVIISSLNDVIGLKYTVDKLLLDKYPSLEIIVIDGASADHTDDSIKYFIDRISHFVFEPDLGIYDAWNKGLRLARGEYIAFLGAGDSYSEEGLSCLVRSAIANPSADFISSRLEIIRDEMLIRTIGSAWQWTKFRRFMNAVHAGSLHSRRLFDLYGEFDTSYKIAGDYELLLRAHKTLKTSYVDSVTVRMLADGASHAGYRVFSETEFAKIKNNSVPRWLARLDRYIACAKRYVRTHCFD